VTGAFYSVAARLGTVAVRSEGPSTHYGSGVAAKQYDPGAPFFIGHQSSVVGHQTLLETKTLLSKPEKGHSDRRLTTDD
jgi:hypothetical protein